MAYEIEAGFENICRKILESSRNALYINMRYLDVALSSLAWEITTDIPRIGTDGLKIAYEPHYLADLYRENPMLVNRVYLHMVFHCIFRHLFRPCPEDREELTKADYRPEQRARMVQEFCIDDHTYWPAPPEEEGPKPPSPLMAKLKKHWKDVSDRMQTELSIGREAGTEDGDLSDELAVENRERYDYRMFLKKFAVLKEEMQIDPDSFDYVFYSYGLRMYGNMPLIEPQEWKETHKIEEFVIVIDTSMSCSGDLVRKFLEETYHILAETESFFRKVHIRILQCDDAVRADQLITTGEELKQYMDHLQLYGDGGTDFRPAFTYVQQLIDQGEFKNLKGLLYFTDGKGTFPRKRPPYDAAFILFREDYKEVSVPPWAIRLMLDEEDL